MITHPFQYKCDKDILPIILGQETLSGFIDQVISNCDKASNRYDPKTFMGDAFELLVEALCKSMGMTPQIGITDYKVVDIAEDYGVDGVGIGNDGNVATVQVKFRGHDYNYNKKELIATKDGLVNFAWTSVAHYGVPVDTKTNMLVVTTAKGMYGPSADVNGMLRGKVRCLGYKELSKLIDKNKPFWLYLQNNLQKDNKGN